MQLITILLPKDRRTHKSSMTFLTSDGQNQFFFYDGAVIAQLSVEQFS